MAAVVAVAVTEACAPIILARAHIADLGASQPAKPGGLRVAIAALTQPVDLVLCEGGHGDALDAVRDSLVPRFTIPAYERTAPDGGGAQHSRQPKGRGREQQGRQVGREMGAGMHSFLTRT